MAKSKTLLTESAPRGCGGSYARDPVTGIRTLITPATSESAPCCGPDNPSAPTTEPLPAAIPLDTDTNEGDTLNG